MPTLCEISNDLSTEIHEWMSAQPEVKEESLTDWLLYELSKRSPQVAYKAFSRHQEAKYTGADWDWFIVFNDGLVKLRVQAKKLFDGQDNYPGLARSNRYGQQITTLITSTAKESAYPIYVFYSAANTISACHGTYTVLTGAFLCGAKKVDANFLINRKRVDAPDVISHSYPLPCIFCCPMANRGSAIDLITQLYYYFESDETRGAIPVDKYQGYSKSVPAAIKSIIDNNFKFPEWWESEFPQMFEDVRAIAVVDARR